MNCVNVDGKNKINVDMISDVANMTSAGVNTNNMISDVAKYHVSWFESRINVVMISDVANITSAVVNINNMISDVANITSADLKAG